MHSQAEKTFRTDKFMLSVYPFLQQVQQAIQKAPNNAKLKGLLNRLEDFPNIPRKKRKFEVIGEIL